MNILNGSDWMDATFTRTTLNSYVSMRLASCELLDLVGSAYVE